MDQSLRQIAERTVGPWLESREGDVRADRTAGRRAATRDFALLQRRHADFEGGLLGRAKAAVLALRAELDEHARELGRQVDDLARERDEHIGQKLQQAREERQRVLQTLESTRGPRSAPYMAASQRLEEAERVHRGVRAEVHGRPLRRGLVRAYLPLLVALALIEVPVNRLAFELFFQEQPALSLALAAAAGAMLMFFAHLVGLLFRRAEQPGPLARHAKRYAGAALFLMLAGGLMYVLASMRQLYVHLLEAEQGSGLREQVERLTQGGAAQTVASVTSTQLGTAGVTLLVINVALFAFGAAASFLRHDPHPDYESAWRGQERARRRLDRLKGRYEREVGARRRDFDERLAALDALMRETETRHDELAARRDGVEPFYTQTAARVGNTVRNRSIAYLEGAIAALPDAPAGGSIADLRPATEARILAEIAGGE